MIAIIDYGMGNLKSVSKAFEELGAKVKIASCPADIEGASKVVFPGVGSFSNGLKGLTQRGLIEPIKVSIREEKPFLGLCLGLQLLFDESEEAPDEKGLGLLKGRVRKIPSLAEGKRIKIPHIGWNQLSLTEEGRKAPLFDGVKSGDFVYFVHSYIVEPEDESIITSTTDYAVDFCSSIKKDNIYATQFHPEKSQKVGLKILENFIRI
jgi:imidazole glycerol-phosphate synthase subunit HisH